MLEWILIITIVLFIKIFGGIDDSLKRIADVLERKEKYYEYEKKQKKL